MKPSPREIKAVVEALSREFDDIEDAARAAITALDEVRVTKDQWIVVARPLAGGPDIAVGPWTTKNQALKASEEFVSAHKEPTPGTGKIIMSMRQPNWLEKIKNG